MNVDKKPEDLLNLLKNRVDLEQIPFTERGSRLLVMNSPTGLQVRLAERWAKLEKSVSGYRDRPPLLQDFVFTDGVGRPLEWTLESYPHRLNFVTEIGIFSLLFLDTETLYLSLPEPACGLRFTANMDNGVTDRRGGVLRVTGDIRRSSAYTTNRPMRSNRLAQVDGQITAEIQFEPGPEAGLQLNVTPRLGFNRYVPGTLAVVDAAEKRWASWFGKVPPVPERYLSQYLYAWWVMGAGLISTRYYLTREAMTPSKPHYVGVWQWDAYFHAMAYRHAFPDLARDQFRIILDHQRSDGMLPDAVHDEGVITHLDFPVDADVTKPPLLAWAAWKVHQSHPDPQFLDEIYDPAVRWNQWWFDNCDSDHDGLCEYTHPYSSGLDDNPLWDDGVPVCSPDLNTYLTLHMEALGRIAEVIGRHAEAEEWERRAQAQVELMLARLWDESSGLFLALRSGKPVSVLTPFNLFPLLTGRLPAPVARKLVEHLFNPAEFWTASPVPTVAVSDPKFDGGRMWRGPVWINVNYLLIEGLRRSGFDPQAEKLRCRTLDLLLRQPDFREYFDPATGEACARSAHMFGWSAALFIDLLLGENVTKEWRTGDKKQS